MFLIRFAVSQTPLTPPVMVAERFEQEPDKT